MKLIARSLPLTVILYLCVLMAVFASLYGALVALTPAVYASLQDLGERTPSRLEEAVANAREVRKALATPLPPIEPLGPITSKLARSASQKAAREPRPRLGAEARDAFASSDHRGAFASPETGGTRGHAYVDIDRHRPQ